MKGELRSARVRQEQFFNSGATLERAARVEALQALKQGIKIRQKKVEQALAADLAKSSAEAYITEVGLVLNEIDHALKHLRAWMRPQRVSTPLALEPARSYTRKVPLGTVLIIAPWNYPFQLLLGPLIGAIAAGNVAVVKPSEEAPATAALLEELLHHTFDKQWVTCWLGPGKEVVDALCQEYHFNHIFFTGSTAVGRKIALLSASHGCTCTLELGGKSPCIVANSAALKQAARRIVWGKFTNAGQTCIAPDYLLVEAESVGELTAHMIRAITDFYGSNPAESAHYARIVNQYHFRRLIGLLQGHTVIHGGQSSADDRYLAPTLIRLEQLDTPLMEEEIFGPLLPIIPFSTTDELLSAIRAFPEPLALYYFGSNSSLYRSLEEQVPFGTACYNTTILQFGNPHLPFGGVGSSGAGRAHGYHSFDTFSHTKAILKAGTWIDPALKYPPYSPGKFRWIKRLIRW